MSSKAPPSAGVKKKIVKTIRKTVPKSKSKPTLVESTPSATATDAPPPSASPEPSAIMSTAPDAAAVTAVTAPLPEIAVTDTTPNASDLASAETPLTLPAAPETTPESSTTAAADTTPNAFELAATETPATQLAVPETTPNPSETAAEKPAGKTTTRVRKVVKRVVVKKIRKVSSAAEEGKKAAVALSAAAVENPNPNSSAAAAGASTRKEELVEQDKGDRVESAVAGGNAAEMSEGKRRRKTEIFIGGLNRDAKEEDIRKVFGRVGEIMEVRMMVDVKSGKNKGYAFLRYTDASQAKRAVSELAKVEVCGKLCGAAALEANDTIYLGNIDKKWKKEDILKLLQDNGIEKIDTITVMVDPNNAEFNRGFAFLELETNKDAQIVYKKLQKKDVFGKGRNVKVSWAEPMTDPDEDQMQKVKSVYVDGIPSSWTEDKVRESFKRFGEIERIVLARNIKSAKRNDFAFVNYTTRKAALSCIESFNYEGLTDNGTKVDVKVSMANPVHKQNKGGSKSSNKDNINDTHKAFQRNTKAPISLNKGEPFKGGRTTNGRNQESSTTHELLHVLREQAAWNQEQVGYTRGPALQDYTHASHGVKRPFSALGHDTPHSDLSVYPRARLDTSFPVTTSSYGVMPYGMTGSSLSYNQHQGLGYPIGAPYVASDPSSTLQGKQGAYPYGSNLYSRY